MKVMSFPERLIWITVVLISWLYIYVCSQRAPRHWDNMTTEEVDSWIKHQLPAGSSRINVEHFLDREGIERYWSEDESGSPNGNNLIAIIKGVNHRNPVFINRDIATIFKFADDKLTNYQNEIRLTGL